MERLGSLRRVDLLTFAIVVAVATVSLSVIGAADDPIEALVRKGHDEIMRLIFLRDWLGGAEWFDTRLEHIAPPEGLSLHWSRYVDVPLAGLIWLFGLVVSPQAAEAAAIVVWPTLLLIAFLSATTLAAHRLFGRHGAAFALLGAVTWEILSRVRFGPIRLDHHGAQILLLLAVVLTLVSARPNWRVGVMGGLAAALSLAIGLEMLPALALIGLILVVRTVQEPDHAGQLAGFGLALGLGSVAFFIGQTPRVEWFIAHCDELSPPFLALSLSGGAGAMAIAFAARRISGLGGRIAVSTGLLVVSAAAAQPALMPCFAGPYQNLAPELQDLIATGIPEARPAYLNLTPGYDIGPLFTLFLTPAVACILGTVYLAGPGVSPAQRRALWVLLPLGWMGLLGCALAQWRMLILAEPVVPLLIGCVGARLIAGWQSNPTRSAPKLAMVAGIAALLLPGLLYKQVQPLLPQAVGPAQAATVAGEPHVPLDTCRAQPDVVRSLNELPPARLMAMGNMGLPVLLLTHHSTYTVSYHRSEVAIRSALLHFERDADAFHRFLVEAGAEYLVLCRHVTYGDGAGRINRLSQGEPMAGLEPVEIADPALVVLRVVAR